MQCVIPSQNMRILVRALYSLSRIGDDVYVESTEDGLCFRTVNSAQSAYSSVTFCTPFFVQYKSEFSTEEGGKCKLSMKAVLSVFKTPHSMDRNVESGQIAIDEECVRVNFQIRYVQGYTKHYYLTVADNANVQLKYNKDEMRNKMSILSKTLISAIKHFRANDEEITLSVKNDKASLRNYSCDVEADNQKVVRTNLSLQSSEFEIYEINLPGSITFTLREIKAVCTFSELSNSSPVGIFFGEAGKPVIFSIRNEQLYEADYVISTLAPEMMTGERRHRRSQLSDVVSSVPSTTSGVTGAQKKRKLAPVTEEAEPDPTPGPSKKNPSIAEGPQPRVSLVDIVRYSDEFRQLHARNGTPTEHTPIANNKTGETSSRRESVRIQPARLSVANCMAETPPVRREDPPLLEMADTPDDVNFFPVDDVQMICDQVEEMTRSQKNDIRHVFQDCFDYRLESIASPIISENEILSNASDIFDT